MKEVILAEIIPSESLSLFCAAAHKLLCHTVCLPMRGVENNHCVLCNGLSVEDVRNENTVCVDVA